MPFSPTETRALLAQLGHEPKRALGQNFLVDGNIVHKSLEVAQIDPEDTVVEIGPGLGTLTGALLATGAEVWAIEKDERLHAHLLSTLGGPYLGRLRLSLGDAVEHPRAGLPAYVSRFKVVANLPYAISTPWMDALLMGPLPVRLVLMLQRETAQRYSARPGTKLFGAISIFLQSAYLIAPGHPVSARCFYPRPEVDSRLFHLLLRPHPYVFSEESKLLIRYCFQHRRKQLGTILKTWLPSQRERWFDSLAAFGFGPRNRAEEIPVPVWQQLAQPAA